MIYIAAFMCSALLFHLSHRVKNRDCRLLLCVLGIVVLAVLAGCRSSSVGTDVLTYGQRNFYRANNSANFGEYYQNYVSAFLAEPLYHLVIYSTSRLSDNYHFALFVLNLIAMAAVYLGFVRIEKAYSIESSFTMLIFCFLGYNISLNIMRQMIAVGFVFLASTYFIEKSYKKTALFMLLAIGFHTSAVFGIAIFLMYIMLNENKRSSTQKKILQGVGFILLMLLIISVGSKLVVLLVGKGVFRENYLNYLAGGKYESNVISLVSICLYGIYFLISLCMYPYAKKNKDCLFYTMVCFVYFTCAFSSLISTYLVRIGYYFIPLVAVHMASLQQCFSKKSRWIWTVIIIGLVFVSWYVVFVLRGNHQTIPYVFDLKP